MAHSPKTVEQRLDKLETDVGELKGAVLQIATLMAEQGERVTAGFRQVWEEQRAMREEMRALGERMDGVTSRLDRLIDVTIRERTASTDRLATIEARLAKLEERVGV